MSCLLWFYLSPQIRYGGAFCFIFSFSVLFKFINNKIKRHIMVFNMILLVLFAVIYVEYKNINDV